MAKFVIVAVPVTSPVKVILKSLTSKSKFSFVASQVTLIPDSVLLAIRLYALYLVTIEVVLVVPSVSIPINCQASSGLTNDEPL